MIENISPGIGNSGNMRTKDSKGFTLIELWVVIAIIALLLAILMPSLQAAKKRGQAVVCLNNLKQIGMAANFYASDYEDRIPRGEGKKKELIWFMRFLPYVGHKSITDYKLVDIYKCKAFPRSGAGLPNSNFPGGAPNSKQTVCYVVNAWDFTDPDYMNGSQTHDPIKLSKIRTRSATAYLTDNEAGSWRPIIENEFSSDIARCDIFHPGHLPMSTNETDRTHGRRIARERHGDGCNLLFFDWHAEQMKAEDITIRTLRTR